MKVLIACEESQTVCKEFRKLGHEAYSCDIIECSGGHPEWHIKGDVLPLLNGNCSFVTMDYKEHDINGKWDLIIAFPPCTHLAVSGAAWFEKKRADGRQREGIELFCKFFEADCEKVVIENPIGIISGDYIKTHFPDLAEKYGLPKKPTQIIHPWMFGDNYNKSTCLWQKGVDPLAPEVTDQPELDWFEWTDSKTGKKKRQPKWFADAWHLPPAERAKVRSKTFPGIARAMAEQWGGRMNIKDYDSMLRSLEERPPLPLYQEILKLEEMLAENDIPHEISRLFDGWVIRSAQGTVIEHLSSYGGGKDLIEIWGFGLRQPQGWLTAEQAFERIKGVKQ